MGVPRIVRRLEAAKKDTTRGKVPSGIAKIKKKRSDKLRAAAGAFSALAQQDRPDGSGPMADGLESKYHIHEKIGQGKRDVAVYRCTEHASGRQFAVKRVPKEQLLGHTHSNEQPVMAALRGSSALVSVHEVLEGVMTVDYVMELASGGDLFEWVMKNGALCEQRAKAIFTGLVQGLKQVHAAGLLHRDVKLENILLMSSEPCAPQHVRLADFEFCTPPPAQGDVGSIGYAAPETLTGELYGESVDIWAAGIALFAMLSAAAPFDVPEDVGATVSRIREGKLSFTEPIWARVSPEAKNLIQGLLQPDPAARLSLDQAMAHPWLVGSVASDESDESTPSVKRPKFALRCTWHSKIKRWGQGLEGPSQEGQVPMLVEAGAPNVPLVACPIEWAPAHTTKTRAESVTTTRTRAMSM